MSTVKAAAGFYYDHRVEFVASDHSPSPPSMKEGNDFFRIWGGIAGVQSTLAAMLTLDRPRLSIDRVARYTSQRVADRFGIGSKGRIQNGGDADLTFVDLSAEYTLKRDMLLDRHKLSPYVGRRFRGLIRRTMVRGHTVFADGKAASDFRGRLVRPARTPRT